MFKDVENGVTMNWIGWRKKITIVDTKHDIGNNYGVKYRIGWLYSDYSGYSVYSVLHLDFHFHFTSQRQKFTPFLIL